MLNADLERRCRTRQDERAEQYAESIGTRLVADRAVLRVQPAVPLEPCEKRAGRVSSTALVRYRRNDDSVPTAYGFRGVLVKDFIEEVRSYAAASRSPGTCVATAPVCSCPTRCITLR